MAIGGRSSGTDLIFAVLDDLFVGDQAVPDLRQRLQHPPIAIALQRLCVRDRRERLLKAGEVGEQIVEAAILSIDHDDRIDVRAQGGIADRATSGDRCTPRRGRRRGTGGAGDAGSHDATEQQATALVHRLIVFGTIVTLVGHRLPFD